MNILILGGGGREHSLAWAILQNPKCDTLIVAPGNAGIKQIARCVEIDISNSTQVKNLAKDESIDLVIIGPEAPLALGIADQLRISGVRVFGPSAHAAKLETSKSFTKDICATAKIPTAKFAHFFSPEAAENYIRSKTYPIVIKADGLAAGKGVVVAFDEITALQAINNLFAGQLGDVKNGVLVEEFIDGEEASLFVLCDGEEILPIGTAQDHKKVGEGDIGLNTGGMGAYSPAPVLTAEIQSKAIQQIIYPTIKEMKQRGIPYQGVLYAGLMINDGTPYLIEYNVRFGDPEAQVLMMRLGAQALDLIQATCEARLSEMQVNWANDHAICIVMATKGYPQNFCKGSEIKGLDKLSQTSHEMCFHAGTKIGKNGAIIANSGRVLNATARGATLKEAHNIAYSMIKAIEWSEGFYRQDIGWRALD
ncbi:MAG: phosphoribosylamine--glycine ligase [Aestuariivita sp.]|nr:phosphoribosylamine--glycine ligase [Aestuariivita sp.]